MWLLTMEKSCSPYFLPGELLVTLRDISNQSIGEDLNMIIEEYGFWSMCTVKDQMMIVKELFSDILDGLSPILDGCE